MPEDKPDQVFKRILKASSFKLNWVVDPFARTGEIGMIAKKMGRRFIGFEIFFLITTKVRAMFR